MLKVSENPPMRPPRHESVTLMQGQWWVAHTRSRFEKAFAWDLAARDIAYFLPMVQRVKLSGGRKRRVFLPLFPSYVFFCGGHKDRYSAMTTNRLCRTLDVADQAALVAELHAIERALDGGADLDLHPFAVVGRRCRVKAGPFRGVEGVVVSRAERARLALQVTILGQAVVREIDADLLEPL